MSDKPTGVAASQATAAEIGIAMQAIEGFEPVKLPQWELVGKETDGTPIYRNNWGEYSPWILVDEQMPPLARYVWAWDGKKVSFTAWTPSDNQQFDSHGITHWMEIVPPSPPMVAQ